MYNSKFEQINSIRKNKQDYNKLALKNSFYSVVVGKSDDVSY